MSHAEYQARHEIGGTWVDVDASDAEEAARQYCEDCWHNDWGTAPLVEELRAIDVFVRPIDDLEDVTKWSVSLHFDVPRFEADEFEE